MKRMLTRLVAALALTSSVAIAVPAEARPDRWRGGYDRHYDGGRWDRGDRWRGDRYRGERWGGDRYRGGWGRDRYWGGSRYYRNAPRYYGYGYGPPRGRYYRDGGGDVLLGAIAGVAIGAAIANSD